MSSLTSAAPAVAHDRPQHPIALRSGLVLGAAALILSAIPAVGEIGFDGTGWDVLVAAMAVLCPAAALAALALLPFAWNGRRGPSLWSAGLQLGSIVLLLPPFVLVFTDGLPLIAPLGAAITILLQVLFAGLILHGMRRR